MIAEIERQLVERMAGADERFGDFASTHEALGVALEEFRELTEAIHANDGRAIEREAIDLAAVCVRLAEHCAYPSSAFERRSGIG